MSFALKLKLPQKSRSSPLGLIAIDQLGLGLLLKHRHYTQNGYYRRFLWPFKIRTIVIMVFQFRVVAGTL
jgi:hypothetical protein